MGAIPIHPALNIGRSSNGRTRAFEALHVGSIPTLPAKLGCSSTVEQLLVKQLVRGSSPFVPAIRVKDYGSRRALDALSVGSTPTTLTLKIKY